MDCILIVLLYRAPHLHDVLRVAALKHLLVVCEVPDVPEHLVDDRDNGVFVFDTLDVLQSQHWHFLVEGVEILLQVQADVVYECLRWRAGLWIHVCARFNVYTASVCSCMVLLWC